MTQNQFVQLMQYCGVEHGKLCLRQADDVAKGGLSGRTLLADPIAAKP